MREIIFRSLGLLLLLVMFINSSTAQDDSGEATPMSPEAQALDLAAKSVALKQAKLDYMQDALTGAFATINKPEVSDKALPEAQLAAYFALAGALNEALPSRESDTKKTCGRFILGYDGLSADGARYSVFLQDARRVAEAIKRFNTAFGGPASEPTNQQSEQRLDTVGGAVAGLSLLSQIAQTQETIGGATIAVGDRSLAFLLLDKLSTTLVKPVSYPPILVIDPSTILTMPDVTTISAGTAPLQALSERLADLSLLLAQYKKAEDKVTKTSIAEKIRETLKKIEANWKFKFELPSPPDDSDIERLSLLTVSWTSAVQSLKTGADRVLNIFYNQDALPTLQSILRGSTIYPALPKDASEASVGPPAEKVQDPDNIVEVIEKMSNDLSQVKDTVIEIRDLLKSTSREANSTEAIKAQPLQRESASGSGCIVDVVVHSAGGSHRYVRSFWSNFRRKENLGLRGVAYVTVLIRTLDNRVVHVKTSASTSTFGNFKTIENVPTKQITSP